MNANGNHFEEAAKELKPIDLLPLPAEPLVSVLMANYNYEKYIGEAIESVLNQTHQNFEIIVCDDGSTDNSRQVVQRYAARDPRVRLIAKENGGVASALNAAYAASRGEVICLLDSDDMFLPEKAEEVIGAFRKFPRSGVCHHKLQKVDRTIGRSYSPFPVVFAEGWVALEALRGGGMVKKLPLRHVSATSGMSWRRNVLDLLFPLPLVFLALDAYLSQASQFVTEVCAVRRVLAIYRYHGTDCQSGGDRFTAAYMRRNLKIMSDITAFLRGFLRARYGEAPASRLRLEDNNLYACHLAVLRVLTGDGRDGDGNGGEPLEKIVERIEPRRQRLLVRLLLAIPPGAARQLLRLWAGNSPWDALAVQAGRWLMRV